MLVYTTRPIANLPAQHPATRIVGQVVGLAPGNSMRVKITHSHHPDFQVGKTYLLCGKRLQKALLDGDSVYDVNTMQEVTPGPVHDEASKTEGM
jgi:hypothetical protein